MIEFYGQIEKDIISEFTKFKKRRLILILFLFTVFFCSVLLPIELLLRIDITSTLFITGLLLLVCLTLLITGVDVKIFKVECRVKVEEDKIILFSFKDIQPYSVYPITRVKKVIDRGDFYYVLFKYKDITSAWIVVKKLIIKGTIEQFETIFKDKIIKKYK